MEGSDPTPNDESASHEAFLDELRTKELGTRLSGVQAAVDVASRSAVMVGGVCYVAGLLIVNLHLAQYGVYNLSILQARYVLVGGLWTFLVASTASLLALAINTGRGLYVWLRATSEGEDKPPPGLAVKSFVPMLAAVATVLACAGEVLIWISIVSFVSGYQLMLWMTPETTIRALGILFVTANVWFASVRDYAGFRAGLADLFILRRPDVRQILKPTSSRLSQLGADNSRGLFLFSLKAALNIGALSAYALYVYPFFPPAIGGGRLPTIALVVSPEHADMLRDLDVALMPNSRVFEPLELIVEADDSFLFALPRTSRFSTQIRSVWIKKESVDSARYLRELALHFEGHYAERSPSSPTPTLTRPPAGEAFTPSASGRTTASP